ncbi:Rod shape-determining protein MreB [uncultured Candidatus Thioglobus sp.]|nr:Rod shape-determining protein MreB [uncultured Candidatus Thioglobus sp.]
MFGLFKFPRLAIDLGTVNTLIYLNNELVLDEPSVVAVHDDGRSREKTVIAVGKEAKNMLGRTPGSIEAIRPMQDGVIADFTITKKMLQHFIKQVMHSGFFSPSPCVLICTPVGATQVERRAIKESAVEAGAKEVFLIDEPIAAALGAGLDIGESAGHMVIDIGGGTSEIAILSLNGVVYADSLRVAGDAFNEEIVKFVRAQHKIIIGDNTAEKIKEEVGCAFKTSAVKKKTYIGRGIASGLPEKFVMTNTQVLEAMQVPLNAIVNAIRVALEKTPPELSSDIAENGVMLMGGGALLEGLDQLIRSRTNLDVHIAEDPLTCVARGGSIALDLIDKHNMTFLSSE